VALSRLLLAWLLVLTWLLLWEGMARQAGRGGTGPWIRAPLWNYAGEAALLTLLGALWFASLGMGSWWLVFLLVGALAAWPPPEGGRRTRRRTSRELGGRALRVVRIVAAGGLLAWRLGLS
jgi:hypothetical protein